MFISNTDKALIFKTLADLTLRVDQLARSLNAALDTKTTKPVKDKVIPPVKKPPAKRNAYARAYYQRKKYEKLVAEQKA